MTNVRPFKTLSELDGARTDPRSAPDRDYYRLVATARAALSGERATSHPSGADLIAAERARQVSAEGWSPEHDDTHAAGELALAAAAYTIPTRNVCCIPREGLWPWSSEWWKPDNRVRELVKAGALIAAEIDRLQRAGA